MRNAIAILPVVSAIYPIITGATAPPTIVMISNEEASLVFVPASLNASEKMVGNMMRSPRVVSIRSTPYCISQKKMLYLCTAASFF